jgi:hypothetical protein
MPRLELDFLPDNATPSDEDLLMQLVYGLCGSLRDSREEKCASFVTSEGIPKPEVRRLAKLLVEKLKLPISIERVDEWIDWQRSNQCWIVSEEMSNHATKLASRNMAQA